MIRAFIAFIAGAEFEVRLVRTQTGKNIPGRCIGKGGYFKCRKIFKKKQGKYGELLRLQAVSVLDWKINDDAGELEPWSAVVEAAGSVGVSVSVNSSVPRETIAQAATRFGITESNTRQSDFMHKHQDEPNVAGPDETDLVEPNAPYVHHCDSDGPMEFFDEARGYLPTCTICGEIRSEQVADSLDPAV